MLGDAQEKLDSRYILTSQGVNIDQLIELASLQFSLSPETVTGGRKNRDTVKARCIVCFWAVHRLGMTMTAVAKKLGISVSTVSLSVGKGERLAREENIARAVQSNTVGLIVVPAAIVSITPAGTVTSPVTSTVPLQVSSPPNVPVVVGKLVSIVN